VVKSCQVATSLLVAFSAPQPTPVLAVVPYEQIDSLNAKRTNGCLQHLQESSIVAVLRNDGDDLPAGTWTLNE